MPSQNKTIRGVKVEEYIESAYEMVKWLDVFNDAGRDIFGEDYEDVLVLVGIANIGLSRAINDFFDSAEEYAKKVHESKDKKGEDWMKQFGIKLEGNDDSKPS